MTKPLNKTQPGTLSQYPDTLTRDPNQPITALTHKPEQPHILPRFPLVIQAQNLAPKQQFSSKKAVRKILFLPFISDSSKKS